MRVQRFVKDGIKAEQYHQKRQNTVNAHTVSVAHEDNEEDGDTKNRYEQKKGTLCQEERRKYRHGAKRNKRTPQCHEKKPSFESRDGKSFEWFTAVW